MRPLHPPRLAALLALGLAAAPAAAQAPLALDSLHLRSLQARLDGFASGLTAEERALWNGLLLRAAAAPASGAEVRVARVLQIGPGGGCDGGTESDAAGRVAVIVQGGGIAGTGIVVQGGRTPSATEGIVVQGGRTPAAPGGIVVQGGRTGGRPGAPAADAPRPGGACVVAIGPKQDDPGRPGSTGAVAIGPKQDDPGRPARAGVVAARPGDDEPGAPRPGNAAVAIGPKQDDPAPPSQSLGRRLTEFWRRLPAEERGALDWLLTRAAAAPEGRPGTPGGLPPGMAVSLRQALGIDRLAIGPKQDDPTPPPPSRRWMLRY